MLPFVSNCCVHHTMPFCIVGLVTVGSHLQYTMPSQVVVESPRPLVRVQSRRTVNPLFGREMNPSSQDSNAKTRQSDTKGGARLANTKESDGKGSAIYEHPPRPPPRPSLKFKGSKSPEHPASPGRRRTPQPEVAEIFEEVVNCSTEQLSPTGTPTRESKRRGATPDNLVPRQKSRQPTGRWQREKQAERERMHQQVEEEFDPRVLSPLRAKSVRLASRPLPEAPVSMAPRQPQSRSMKRAANKSVRNRAKSVKAIGGVKEHLSEKARRQKQLEYEQQIQYEQEQRAVRRQSQGMQRKSIRRQSVARQSQRRPSGIRESTAQASARRQSQSRQAGSLRQSQSRQSTGRQSQQRQEADQRSHSSMDNSTASSSAQPKQARKSKERVTRLEFMSSSTDAEELAIQRREAQEARRERRRSSAAPKTNSRESQKAFSRNKHRSIKLEASGSSICDDPAPRRVSVARQSTGRWTAGTKQSGVAPRRSNESAGTSGPSNTSAELKMTNNLPDDAQSKAKRKRRGTGRWNGGQNPVPSGTPQSKTVVQSTKSDEQATISRKRNGTGRWSAEQRRASSGLKTKADTKTEPIADSDDSEEETYSYASASKLPLVNNTVLNDAIDLAESAWRDLADYRECSLDDVAHESQLVIDEGSELRLPIWRVEQLGHKREDAMASYTRRQRRRRMKLEKKLLAQKRQIEKLIANYFPPQEC